MRIAAGGIDWLATGGPDGAVLLSSLTTSAGRGGKVIRQSQGRMCQPAEEMPSIPWPLWGRAIILPGDSQAVASNNLFLEVLVWKHRVDGLQFLCNSPRPW
jgi:hypothetical protein